MNTIATLAFILLAFCSVQGSDLDNVKQLPKFAVEEQTYTIQEGGDVNISCAVFGNTTYLRIVKKVRGHGNNEKLLFVGDNSIIRKSKYTMNNDFMTIRNVTRNDAGEYMCFFQSEPVVEVTHTLDVHYAPTISSPIHKNQTVIKGQSVTMECEVEGNPVPKITWSHAGGSLPDGYEGEEDGSLTLLDVNRHAEGTYICKADNGIGRPATEEMSISVEYAPEIVTQNDIVYTGEGDKIEIVCIVYSRPAAEVTWQKDGSAVDNEPNMEEAWEEGVGGHRYILMLEKVTEEMFGDYSCHAKNNHGETEATIILTDFPMAPNFTSDAIGRETTSYTLIFETESYYPIIEYQIKYKKAKANDSSEEPGSWVDLGSMVVEDVDTSEKTHSLRYTIQDLEQATEYEVVAAVKNQKKWSNESYFLFSTTEYIPQDRTGTTNMPQGHKFTTRIPQGRIATSGSTSLLGASNNMHQGSTETSGSSSLLGVSTRILVIAAALMLNH